MIPFLTNLKTKEKWHSSNCHLNQIEFTTMEKPEKKPEKPIENQRKTREKTEKKPEKTH